MHKLVIGIAGASGAIYARRLLERLAEIPDQWVEVGIVASTNARTNWELEDQPVDLESFGYKIYASHDFLAPFASGSARFDAMIICPCSMGVLARIAHGLSDDLMTRAADVILKERRKLILVPRETPLSRIHLENMLRITDAGGIICPAIPSFYTGAITAEDLAQTVVDRALELAGFQLDTFRWGAENQKN
jgi:4-hydroxy-3-polyprenylbenzoate decarboxylase